MIPENPEKNAAPVHSRGEDWTYEAWFERMGRKPRFIARLQTRPLAPIERPSFLSA